MNYYEILEIPETSTDKEIKKAYKKLVKKYHPDIFVGDKSFAENKIKEINEAYDILSDANLRKKYDKTLHQPEISFDDFEESSKNKDCDNISKYEDLYKYDYYKHYTTNYYGVSRNDLHNNYANQNVKDSDFFTGSKSRFILVIGLSIVFVLMILLILLSYLSTLISSNPVNDIDNSLPYIHFGMTFNDVKDLLGYPDSSEVKNSGTYMYWGNSYIIFDNDYYVSGWKNNGDFYTDTSTGEQTKYIQNIYNSFQDF